MIVHNQAEQAALYWQGRVVRLIRARENAVFEIETPDGRAALRLHRQGYQHPAAIRSELWWCAALADAGVAVPRPMTAQDGAVLVTLPDGRLASAIRWQDGEALGKTGVPLNASLTVLLEQHRALGRLLAQMHDATDRLTLPADFTRHRWDGPGLVGETPLWGRFWQHPAATTAQSLRLHQVRDWLAGRLAMEGDDLGLIHADVLRENVLVNHRSLWLIDFDDSGFGYRGYDLGTAMLGNLAEPAYADLRDALIDGYAALRPMARETVEMFTLMRACASVGWTMPRLASDDPIHRSHLARCLGFADRIIP